MTKRAHLMANKHTFASFFTALCLSLPASADDIDVYATNNSHKPNIMFMFDYSGSMGRDVNGNDVIPGVTESRLDILRRAITTLVEDNASLVNFGIGSIFAGQASGVRWPASDLEAEASTYDNSIPAGVTVADVLISELYRRQAAGSTATVNALAETAAYFMGNQILHNDADPSFAGGHRPDRWDTAVNGFNGSSFNTALPASYSPKDAYNFNAATGNSYDTCTDFFNGDQNCSGLATYDCRYSANTRSTTCKHLVNESWTGARYDSPVTQQCQANIMILVSDGQPTRRTNTQTLRNAVGQRLNSCEDLSRSIFAGERRRDIATAGNCGPEIVERLANTNLNPDIPDSIVKTYTIGFAVGAGADGRNSGRKYLELLARRGKGDFFEAREPESLSAALSSIVNDVLAESENFTELSIDIDRQKFEHENRTFLSLFTPSAQRSWEGNVKGYFLDEQGLVDGNNQAATINDGGVVRFRDEAQSFWSDAPDGNMVHLGGVNEGLVDVTGPTRNLYTYTGDTSGTINTELALGRDQLLASSNRSLSNAMLDIPNNSPMRDEILTWLERAPMGDPLHTKPVLINYPGQSVMFVMTNQGFMHAFDASNPTSPDTPDFSGGEELFAFMPKELLGNLKDIYQNRIGDDHIYGLDGPITRWHMDENRDGIVNNGEEATLIFAMRRGGKSIYAMDVTDPELPRLKWQINAGDTGFEDLAQTWSRPSLIAVNNGGTTEQVLMFGGGYDGSLDGLMSSRPANGNAVYMVREDGSLIWSANNRTHPDMQYSIPSDLSIIDTDGDSLADRAYVGDLGGQVWRIDFDDISEAGDFAVNKFADINDGNYQPIFYPPSVSKTYRDGKNFLSVTFGTGDRTEPLDESSENAIYSIHDYDIEKGKPDSQLSTIYTRNLFNANDNSIASSDPAIASAARARLDASEGWLLYLNPGEKSLSEVVVFEGKVLASTNQSSASTGQNACEVGPTVINRLYNVSLQDARPTIAQSTPDLFTGEIRPAQRSMLLSASGIPSKPVIVLRDNMVQAYVGKEATSLLNKKVKTVFWHAR